MAHHDIDCESHGVRVRCCRGSVLVTAPFVHHLSDRRQLARFASRAFQLPEIRAVEIEHRSATAVFLFEPRNSVGKLLDALAEQLRADHKPAVTEDWDTTFQTDPDGNRYRTRVARKVEPGHRLKRFALASMAAASFALTVAGVIIPGLPTVPFLIATSYFAVRSWPSLNERLLRSRTFGPMLRDWWRYRGLRPGVKFKATALMVAILTISVVTTGMSGGMLVFVLVMAMVGLSMILFLPTVHQRVNDSGEVPRLPAPELTLAVPA